MGMAHRVTASGASVTNPPASAAETVIYTTPAIPAGPDGVPASITGTINITPGTGNTALVVRVRQGSLTGPVVGVAATHTVAAGAAQSISFGATDNSNFLTQAAGVYVVTVSATGATGAGTTNFVDIEVFV